MKSIPCYFCKSPCYYNYDSIKANNIDCQSCSSILGNRAANTLGESENELLYFHMYVSFKDKILHIRLHLQENETHVMNEYEREPLLILPGFPLNPINFTEKLSLYFTFS